MYLQGWVALQICTAILSHSTCNSWERVTIFFSCANALCYIEMWQSCWSLTKLLPERKFYSVSNLIPYEKSNFCFFLFESFSHFHYWATLILKNTCSDKASPKKVVYLLRVNFNFFIIQLSLYHWYFDSYSSTFRPKIKAGKLAVPD